MKLRAVRVDAPGMTFGVERLRSARRAKARCEGQAATRAFTLIELMFIVALLGLLAAIVVPRFTNVTEEADESAVRRYLQIIRNQTAYYRTKNLASPDFLATQWADLLTGNYLHSVPVNPYNQSTVIAGAAAFGVGWVWRDNGYGVHNMYATGSDWAEVAE